MLAVWKGTQDRTSDSCCVKTERRPCYDRRIGGIPRKLNGFDRSSPGLLHGRFRSPDGHFDGHLDGLEASPESPSAIVPAIPATSERGHRQAAIESSFDASHDVSRGSTLCGRAQSRPNSRENPTDPTAPLGRPTWDGPAGQTQLTIGRAGSGRATPHARSTSVTGRSPLGSSPRRRPTGCASTPRRGGCTSRAPG